MEELSNEELKLIATAFKEMKVKPNIESTTEFKDWMVGYVTSLTSTVKEETPDTEGEGATADATEKKVVMTSSYVPKISTFSGDGSKQDTAFELWKYEVECLVRDKYSEPIIAQSIRRSLKGDAGAAAMRLGPEASVKDILKRMEDIFGSVERGETIMEEFYSAAQRKGEDSMKWSCRLEEIYRKAIVKGVAKKEEAKEKLRSRYWNGLHQWLKDITGHKFDQIQDFDELRREVRLIEKEHDKKVTPNMAVTSSGDKEKNELQELKGMIQQLTTKVGSLEQEYHSKEESRRREQPRAASNRQQQQYTPRQQQDTREPMGGEGYRGGYGARGYGRGRYNTGGYSRGGYNTGGYGRGYGNQDQYGYATSQGGADNYNYEEPECWRCGQTGHLARGCRVILDHSRRGLNSNRPSSRGR